ncbi:MAG: hypothetical protein HKN47_16765 [Pirellulaceae bacterium]|nr:hypothetical protein [Pirellulaceae bacterium]
MNALAADFEIYWVAWVITGLVSVASTVLLVKRINWRRCMQLFSSEDGAAYTLSYVMVIPLYLLMVFTFAELSLMMIAKMGTVYSAFGAARTAIVWDTATDSGDLMDKVNRSAVQTMTPFASGMTELRYQRGGAGLDETDQEERFMDAYDEFTQSDSKVARRYVQAKFRYASRATSVTIDRNSTGDETWDEDIRATIRYDYPFVFPVLGRILLIPKKDGAHTKTIKTVVRLQNEIPHNDERRLGISYASP